MTIPGAPEHFLRAELRYDHNSGFWFAPNVEVVPHGSAPFAPQLQSPFDPASPRT